VDATLSIAGAGGKRQLPLKDYYLGYRKTALKAGEFIVGISFNIPEKNSSFALYKASQRKDLDISAVNAAFHIHWKDKTKGLAREVRVALGGVAATPLRLPKTESFLAKGEINAATFAGAAREMQGEIQPLSDLRGSAAFRRIVAEGFLEKFFREHIGVRQLSCPMIPRTPK
jgi:xanthine dehydrogenase small subunit